MGNIFKSSQYKKLVYLKKAYNFPVKPSFNPAILYVQDVLNPQNLTWDHPRKREYNLENTIKTAMGSWPKMNPQVKVLFIDVFETEAKSLKDNYEQEEKEWWEKFGDTDQAVEINKLEKELEKLFPEYH